MGEKKIESIKIIRAEDLPSSVRDEENISAGFVEIRVTRSSPPQTEITQLSETPLKTIRKSFESKNLLGLKITK